MLSDEEKEALRNFKSEYETCDHYSSDLIIELDDAEIILNLIEKQSKEIERINEILIWKQKHEEQLQKEIEELKEKNEYLPSWVNRKYISKDKIKAKIGIRKDEKEICKDSIEEKYLLREIYVLQSLLEKE